MIPAPERPQRESAIPRPPRAADSGRDPMDPEPPPPAPPRPAPARLARPAQTDQGKEAPVGRKQLTAWIRADLHKRMQRLKVEDDLDLKDQLDEALERYLTEKGF